MNKLIIFDTHCHLADEKYREQSKDTKEIIQEAEKVGVQDIVSIHKVKEIIKSIFFWPTSYYILILKRK